MRAMTLLATILFLGVAGPTLAQDANAAQAPPPSGSTAPTDAAAPPANNPAPAAQPSGNPPMTGPQMLISTSMGDITVQLDSVRAPKSVASVVKYVHDRHYNGTVVYRVVKGFLIQMGSWDANVKGRPGHAPSPLEANNGLSNLRGSVALARSAEADSASADFFINTADNIALDHKPDDSGNTTGYTVFGQVIAGMDVVDKISEVPVGDHGPMAGQAPVDPVTITKVSIVGEPDVVPKAAKAPPKKK
ncbi:MAG TPA: peptidylprolyl isomerase [Rhizomicrobium sp.]|jgi:cyclophilin family peptidyl-prolyl cis-trans isomerase|nr:peptidylprolyl isomerase [Rhizomicrobium sp.]